ncbi:hypothetical protein BUALT_Bualt19G0027700 [Buddleja alternifolia]|uniref:PIG-P domain-containing protein n=1 Tax=Buddleja alternifolia TaxID=168488 RepID=A0AAV6W1Y9_9LAMI|nr:hypothetical protein BUALT_Bualt19G0027700 [Buddleja alternifolia]
MEERRSVNRLRRILSSFSKDRITADVPFSDGGDRSQAKIGVSEEREHNFFEVYGFVGSIITLVAAVIFITWAYVPDHWFRSIGIYHYPSRYWALPLPTYVVVTIVLAIGLYSGLDLMAIPPPISLDSMFDEYAEEPVSGMSWTNDNEQHIEAISDVGINQINNSMDSKDV